jgi:hypothetical protein
MAILVDFSPVVHAAIMVFYSDLESSTEDQVQNIIRHAALTTIKSYKKNYGAEYGELIIAVDSGNIWRKDYFQEYKYKRSEDKKESSINWPFIFKCINELSEDLKNYFPYKVIQVDRTEADDIIAVLAKYINENEGDGLFNSDPKILIISGDKDFKQLHYINNLTQYRPIQKDFSKDTTYKKHLINSFIATGDSGDGVPSVLSPDNVFKDKIRQKPLRAERLAEFTTMGREACRTDDERKQWDRNQLMVDFDYIPDGLKKCIINKYITYNVVKDKTRTMQYLINKNCRLLLDDLQDF